MKNEYVTMAVNCNLSKCENNLKNLGGGFKIDFLFIAIHCDGHIFISFMGGFRGDEGAAPPPPPPPFEQNAPLSHVHGIDFVCFISFFCHPKPTFFGHKCSPNAYSKLSSLSETRLFPFFKKETV